MISKIQYITGNVPYDQILYNVRDYCRGGGQWVQLRVKDVSPGKYLEIAQKTKAICNQYNSRLIINDDPHIARAVNADGVHLGKKDMSPADARILLFPHQLVGSTCSSMDDIEEVMSEGKSDYIGLGPVFKTETKKETEPELGTDKLQRIMSQFRKKGFDLPIIAIGGIAYEHIEEVLKTGVNGIAFSSMFEKSENKKELIKRMIQITENKPDHAKFEVSR